jgi:predicted nucleotide-binding protein (sugar kinase/HSP70/actin superfamily)
MNITMRFSRIGIPRAFYYYQYPALWEAFFGALGMEPVVPPPAGAQTIAAASSFTESEHCLAHKIFDAQIIFLLDKAEALFIPRILSMTRRHICCAKFGALPDASRALLRSPGLSSLPVLSPEINEHKKPLGKTLAAFARELGAEKQSAQEAAEWGLGALKQAWDLRIGQNRALPPGRFLLLGHPYTVEEPFIVRGIRDKLSQMAIPLEIMSFESAPLPPSFIRWCGFNKMYRKLLELDVTSYRGVIQIGTFNCGPDSVFTNVFRGICGERKIPFLVITLDEHTAFSGIETRLEAFADSLEWRKRGGEESSHG